MESAAVQPSLTDSPPSDATPTARSSQIWQGIIIAAAAVPLLVGCWNASFTTYDDSMHVFANKRLTSGVRDLVAPIENSTYFPATEFSYQIDRVLFSRWMPAYLHTWAPGVRFMTLLYHIGASLILWRVLRRMKIGETAAFFIALVFACHPLATETVCWASERKNALAALFGFATLWSWLRFDGNILRLPAMILFYLLALLSKPSALGLLPVFVVFELFNVPRGLTGEAPLYVTPSKAWLSILGRMIPMAALALASIVINLKGHAGTMQPPPGGTVFTAILTDLEILSRYLFNLVAPIKLSAAYCVLPIRSPGETRVIGYGALLVSLVGMTLWLSPRRMVTLLGWLWFFGALGPNLNLVAIPHIMQDRYIYLSTPGFFVVLVETISGILAKVRSVTFDTAAQRRVLQIVGGVYVCVLIAFSVSRSAVWSSTLLIFRDAVEKQPASTFAHCGLGNAYAQVWQMLERSDPQQAETYRKQYIAQWRFALQCPDAMRFATYMAMALTVGEEFNRRGDMKSAEQYWTLCATPPTETFDDPPSRAAGLGYLAAIRMMQGRLDDAYEKADASAKLQYADTIVLLRARVAFALADSATKTGDLKAAKEWTDKAVADLNAIPPTSRVYPEAEKLRRPATSDPR